MYDIYAWYNIAQHIRLWYGIVWHGMMHGRYPVIQELDDSGPRNITGGQLPSGALQKPCLSGLYP